MDETVTTPNPVGVPVPPSHVLMTDPKASIPTSKARKFIRVIQVKATKPVPCTVDISTKESRDSSSSDDSKYDSKYHRLNNYSKFHLYQKWCVAKDTTKDFQNENKELLTTVTKLKKYLTFADKTRDVMLDTKRKLQASVESISKFKSENQSLSDMVKCLNRDYKQLLDSKCNEKSHYDATLKLKVATLIQKHKYNVTQTHS